MPTIVAIVSAPAPIASGRTLLEYRRAAASPPGPGRMGVYATAAASAGVSARLYLQSTALESSEVKATRMGMGWAYIVDDAVSRAATLNGQQRQITDGGHSGSLGRLTVSAAFSTAPPAGLAFETHHPIPAVRHLNRDGWKECINRALEQITIRDLLTMAATGAYEYEVTGSPWELDPGRVLGLEDYPSGTDRPSEAATREWRFYHDAERAVLVTPTAYASGDSLRRLVARPASTRIKRNGAWVDVTDGLQADTDEALAPLNLVRTLAIKEAYGVLMSGAVPGDRNVWEDEYARWSARASLARIQHAGPNSRVMRPRVVAASRPGVWWDRA